MRSVRQLVTLTAAATVALLAVTANPASAVPKPPGIVVQNGVTQPVFDYTQAIRERRYVETEIDSDHDGKRDRVEVRVIRPAETERGLKVPVIFQPSPYYAGLNDVPNHDDIDRDDPAAARSAGGADRAAETILFAGYLDNYFVPRGYAVVFADSIGTGGSDGCPTSGDPNETLGMKAVVDWLNGRARGFTPEGDSARATWSTGKTGMIGVSYNATLPNAVATTGVRGLETIVPIAGISSWYDYYRANGGVVAPFPFQGEDTDVLARLVLTRKNPEVCAGVMDELERRQDRETGDYSRYWDERNYVKDAHKVRASVFLVHGLNDWNVRTKNGIQWWNALSSNGVQRKIWLHQGPHTDPFNVRRAEWIATLHRWFDFWLHGVRNGIMNEPMADVETAPNQWTTSRSWPVPGTTQVPLFLGPEAADGRPGTLSRWPSGFGHDQSFVDDTSQTADQLVDNELAADPNRLAFLTTPLTSPVRLSGTPRVTVRASLDGRSPYLTALLVDYGTDVRFAGIATVPGQDCIAPGIPEDPGCFNKRAYVTRETPLKIVSRGWLDVRNRYSQWDETPVAAGRTYTLSWDLQPQDHVFKPGHRIGVVLISTDRDHTLRYRTGTRVEAELGLSHVLLPLS
ncbi:Xaa-Pro dipeptidyl-peptidase [Virgisporangium aurantiacum]|uniref:Xaa-Pro dipeptidyl-peptidase n=1 Tax=Virgisporangium aurantiacum TaxID=175570 RepID=A0A8J4DY05_9ACTN|nr:Xaa-Pro dipeptidyl-peptidase [Virgisporangium aurantiacum]GIJ55135.1 Xaa-Pro dipeptidyl-peptidase [Virgisporangium aurantiacum]